MQIKESLKISECCSSSSNSANKSHLKICQSVVVVTVRIKESLKICQCSSSSSYSANKRVLQNLSDFKTLLFAILLPHSDKKNVIMVLQIKESFKICQGVVVVVKIKESFQIRQSVVVEVQIRESFKICQRVVVVPTK